MFCLFAKGKTFSWKKLNLLLNYVYTTSGRTVLKTKENRLHWGKKRLQIRVERCSAGGARWPLPDRRVGPRNQRLLTALLPLKSTFCPPFPQWEPFPRTQPWESNMLLERLHSICDLTHLRLLYKLFRFWPAGAEILQLPKTSFVCSFPCLSNCLLTTLEGSASFSDLSSPSYIGPSFQTNQRSGLVFPGNTTVYGSPRVHNWTVLFLCWISEIRGLDEVIFEFPSSYKIFCFSDWISDFKASLPIKLIIIPFITVEFI